MEYLTRHFDIEQALKENHLCLDKSKIYYKVIKNSLFNVYNL